MADVNALDDEQCSPLHYAKTQRTQEFLDCVELLVNAGCVNCGPGSRLPSAASPTNSANSSPANSRRNIFIGTPLQSDTEESPTKRNGGGAVPHTPLRTQHTAAAAARPADTNPFTPPSARRAMPLAAGSPSNPFLTGAQPARKIVEPTNPFASASTHSDDSRPESPESQASSPDPHKSIDFTADFDLEQLPNRLV